MSNPFSLDKCELANEKFFMGRNKSVEQLEKYLIGYGQGSVIITGVEGIGKTTLLSMYFSKAKKEELAKIEKTEETQPILVCEADLGTDCGDLYEYLLDRLYYSCRRILSKVSNGKNILEDVAIEVDSGQSPKSRYESVINVLKDYGYRIVLVVDSFEHFTTSTAIKLEHHEMLRNLSESRKLQCVCATNYDLNKDTLPADVKESLYLQTFHNKIKLEGLTVYEIKEYIDNKLQNKEVKFTDEAIQVIYNLTGGIPWLINKLAHYVYDYIKENGSKCEFNKVLRAFLSENIEQNLLPFKNWCKFLTNSQYEVILRLLGDAVRPPEKIIYYNFSNVDSHIKKAANELFNRGFLIESEDENYKYGFNSVLLGFYSLKYKDDILAQVEANPLAEQRARISREREIEEAKSETVMLEKQTATLKRDFLMASLFKANISEDTLKQLNTVNTGLIEVRNSYDSVRIQDAEYYTESERKADELLSCQADQVLVDEVHNGDDSELNQKFKEIIDSFHIGDKIDDALMCKVSETCGKYLKLGLIVEDIYNANRKFFLNDNSISLVYYGKCLEQCMRDNFFNLFREHAYFKDYNTFNKKVEPKGEGTFGVLVSQEQALLGRFYYMISLLKDKLARLFNEQLQKKKIKDIKKVWGNDDWDNFAKKIETAKNTRNLLHAGNVLPTNEAVIELRNQLIGEDGILSLSYVGHCLYESLQGNSTSDVETINLEEVTEEYFDLKVDKFKDKKLDGTIVVNGIEYAIRIERDKIRGTSYANKSEKDLRNDQIKVKIVGINKDKNWLLGEIIN